MGRCFVGTLEALARHWEKQFFMTVRMQKFSIKTKMYKYMKTPREQNYLKIISPRTFYYRESHSKCMIFWWILISLFGREISMILSWNTNVRVSFLHLCKFLILLKICSFEPASKSVSHYVRPMLLTSVYSRSQLFGENVTGYCNITVD